MKLSKHYIHSIVCLFIASLCICLDQLTKYFLYGKNYSLIGDFLWIYSRFNSGAAYSMLSGKTWLFIAVAIVSALLILWIIFSKKMGLGFWLKFALALILGGAVGNMIDRIMFGGVRDFIYLKSIDFAVFNLADSFVTIGGILLAVLLVVYMFKSIEKGKNKSE